MKNVKNKKKKGHKEQRTKTFFTSLLRGYNFIQKPTNRVFIDDLRYFIDTNLHLVQYCM